MALKNILFPIKQFTKKLIGGEGEEEDDNTGDTKMPIYIIIGLVALVLIFYLMKKSEEDYATINKYSRTLPQNQLKLESSKHKINKRGR